MSEKRDTHHAENSSPDPELSLIVKAEVSPTVSAIAPKFARPMFESPLYSILLDAVVERHAYVNAASTIAIEQTA
jgi:hypothetical protein